MTEQEKFEAWFSENGYDEQHRAMFETVWQAAIASRAPMPEDQMKQVISETSAIALFKHQDFVRAIERFHGIGKSNETK